MELAIKRERRRRRRLHVVARTIRAGLPPLLGSLLLLALLANRAACSKGGGEPEASVQTLGGSSPAASFEQYLSQLRHLDKCGAIYTSKRHGFDVREYLVQTSDRYELHVHRLIHPEDFVQRGPKKKPYLLVHGLIGTSASFINNVEPQYRAPPKSFWAGREIQDQLAFNWQNYQYEWKSTAEYLGSNSAHESKSKFFDKRRQFAESLELQFEGPHMRFGREFRQAYKKFRLPDAATGYTTNSLAFTLANFGYDVWLINLRGNRYSRHYNGPLSAESAEYWDFNIETLAREDLAATIRFIVRETNLRADLPIGLVAFSYSAAPVLGLLTKFPKYQQQLRPIVLIAPTLLTASSERGKSRYLMKMANKLVGHNGPFPTWGREAQSGARLKLLDLHNLDRKLEKLVCSLPVAGKLCRLLEMIIQGNKKQVASVHGLLQSDRKSLLVRRDIDCGQTSKAILHQLMENLSEERIHPDYQPFGPAKQWSMLVPGRQAPAQPSIMLVHSDSDTIATPAEVRKIRDTALKTLTLVDYLVREPNFEHTDFLFSQRNQYLVNAEIVRMALVHDHLSYIFDAPPAHTAPRSPQTHAGAPLNGGAAQNTGPAPNRHLL